MKKQKVSQNILIAFLLNFFFSIFEFVGGFVIGSVAIASDAIHDLGDELSIGIAYFLERKSTRKPDAKHTYGYVRYSLLGGVITTAILLTGSIFVIYESIKRFFEPVEVHFDGMIVFAIIGFIVNGFAAYMTSRGKSINQKSVNLHMLEDVLGWAVVLVGAIVMKLTNFAFIDPILSLGVAVFILIEAFRNLKTITDIFLEITPKEINIEEIKTKISELDNVEDVHHIHVRSLDGFYHYATMHVVVEKYDDATKKKIKHALENFNIKHSTIEFELPAEHCHEEKCKPICSGVEHHHHHH